MTWIYLRLPLCPPQCFVLGFQLLRDLALSPTLPPACLSFCLPLCPRICLPRCLLLCFPFCLPLCLPVCFPLCHPLLCEILSRRGFGFVSDFGFSPSALGRLQTELTLPIICLFDPVSGVAAGSLDWCPFISCHHLCPVICYSIPVKGGVRLLNWVSFNFSVHFHLSSIICASSFVSHHLSLQSCVRGSVRLPGLGILLSLNCLPSVVSHDLSPVTCFPNPVSGVVSGFLDVVPSHLSPFIFHLSPIICFPSFVSLILCSGWGPAFWTLCPFTCLLSWAAVVFSLHLSPISCLMICPPNPVPGGSHQPP